MTAEYVVIQVLTLFRIKYTDLIRDPLRRCFLAGDRLGALEDNE
jgi:hypothetical protein